MLQFLKKGRKYASVPTIDDVDTSELHFVGLKESHRREKRRRWCVTIASSAVAFVVFLFAFGSFNFYRDRRQSFSCHNPQVRREWRSLNMKQQYDYIAAAQCLQGIPSKLHPGMSLYDDFPFLHDVVGDYSHEAAPFLPWHRYFIHLYEVMLRENCDYHGSLPYWDWSLDSDNMSSSPVFKSSPGFGGDSHPSSESSEVAIVGGDRCVKDGPFSDLLVHWWTQKGEPHCLSRGFDDIMPMNEIGRSVSPQAIEDLLQIPEYEQFFLHMEHHPHNAIQIAIGGDICFNPAPYDPLFYLHHTQLDRLWWIWQQRHPSQEMQYIGLANSTSAVRATLEDIIPMGDFAPGIAVKHLMNTQRGLLCYHY